jgi:dihydrofolate reductase
MRRICYNVAASLDGYIAGPHGEYDWIVMDPDVDFAAIFARFDTVLMGRKSYDVASAAAGAMPRMKTVVVSRTLASVPPGVVVLRELVSGVEALKREPGKDIWLWGGGELFRALLGAGLVDAIEVSVVPVLLGGGLPMLPPPASRAPLRLTNHRVYSTSGIVTLSYAVGDARRADGDAV